MNTLLLIILFVPLIEIYLFIQIGGVIGAFNTILIILLTAVIGIYFVRLQGLSTLKSGVSQLYRNQIPIYEMISGAALAFAALLLIIPGFATDILGFLLIFPFTRKLVFGSLSKKFKKHETKKNNFIDGEFEDIEDEELDEANINFLTLFFLDKFIIFINPLKLLFK